MKKTTLRKILSIILCTMLVAALAMGTMGCGKKVDEPNNGPVTMENGATLGSGKTSFTFTVVNGEGKEISATIKTDKENVGDALVELGLVSGEDSEYGLMVDTVNGETWKYNETGKYWAFYINGEYATTGVDSTPITEGSTYMLKVE